MDVFDFDLTVPLLPQTNDIYSCSLLDKAYAVQLICIKTVTVMYACVWVSDLQYALQCNGPLVTTL